MIGEIKRFFSKDKPQITDRKTRYLINNIEECLSYFETVQGVEARGLKSIHGRKYTVGRSDAKHFWQGVDGVEHIIEEEVITNGQRIDILLEIQSITFPYKDFYEKKHSKRS